MFLPENYLEALEQYCFINRMEKREAILQAIRLLTSPTAPAASTGSTLPIGTPGVTAINHDVSDDYDDVSKFIISEHLWLTGKNFGASSSDRQSWNAVKHINVQVILAGMLFTTWNLRKTNRRAAISSFSYFVQQIQTLAEKGIDQRMSVEQWIQYMRGKLRRNKLIPEVW